MWVSVKDKLPPTDDKYRKPVLVHEKWNDVPFIGYYSETHGWIVDTSNFDTNGDAIVIEKIDTDDIDYWMEIPELIK
jgi:hypothetical protein